MPVLAAKTRQLSPRLKCYLYAPLGRFKLGATPFYMPADPVEWDDPETPEEEEAPPRFDGATGMCIFATTNSKKDLNLWKKRRAEWGRRKNHEDREYRKAKKEDSAFELLIVWVGVNGKTAVWIR